MQPQGVQPSPRDPAQAHSALSRQNEEMVNMEFSQGLTV